jgi:membrane fusion protein, multidrug efflux system
MKILNLFIICLVLLSGCGKKVIVVPPPHLVSVAKPTVCDVPTYVDYIGHMVAKTSVQVMAQVSGNIVGQYFEEGQFVKRGDLLLVIDPRPFEAAFHQAQGALAQSLASLGFAEETTVRYAPLVQKDFISQLNYDQYVTNVLVDDAIVKQNLANLETSQINLGYCYINAPMDCVTGKLLVKTGNYVDALASTQLTLLNQIQPILVDFYVPETDLFAIQQIQQKNPIKILVYPEPSHQHSYSGELTLIDNQVNTNTGAVLMEGTLPNEENILWPGHYVDVRLILGEQKGAILIPSEAVMIGQKGQYVFVINEDMTVSAKDVKVGQLYQNKYMSILSGITAEDTVITEGQLNLYPGMKVQIKEEQ